MARKRLSDLPTAPEASNEGPNWPSIMEKTYHPDITNAVQHLPFTPPVVTHNSSHEAVMEANQEAIFTLGCHVYEHLRRPHNYIKDVESLVRATRNFLATRQKFLNLESNDSEGTPRKPKCISIG